MDLSQQKSLTQITQILQNRFYAIDVDISMKVTINFGTVVVVVIVIEVDIYTVALLENA